MSMLAGDPRSLGYDAYVYLYPLVTMEVTRRQVTSLAAGQRPSFGPPNEFHHIRAFPAADFRAVVRPNFDTLYSAAWLDLTGGPVVVSVSDTSDRYYMLPMLDMWTDVFASPGKRTTGTGPQELVVVGPGRTHDAADGRPVLHAPTPWVWVIGRTQTNGPADYPAVHAVQDGLGVTALHPVSHAPDPDVDTTSEPLRLVEGMGAVDFFTYACTALMLHPPHSTDFSMLARIAHLGIVPGRPFDPGALDAGALGQLQDGADAAREAIARTFVGTRTNGWVTSTQGMGVYGNDYLKRAAITHLGLGANPPEDAIYPLLLTDADGDPVVGEQSYVMHFAADEVPPVHAFWSVTMYDAEGFQSANVLDRYAIGDRDPLAFNPDGSLDILIQHTSPGTGQESNWLPAPLGPLGITMRLYAPKPSALDGRWAPPPVRKTGPSAAP